MSDVTVELVCHRSWGFDAHVSGGKVVIDHCENVEPEQAAMAAEEIFPQWVIEALDDQSREA